MADEHGLGFLRAPRFGADATESDAGAGDVLARNVDYHCSRGQSELVRRAVAQFEINLLAAGGGRRKCYMCDEVARFKHCLTMRRVAGQNSQLAAEAGNGDGVNTLGHDSALRCYNF